MLDNNSQTVHIVADSYNNLYQLQGNGEIWKYTGTPCKAGVCGGWQKLDDNPLATWITAGGGYLYQFHGNGQIWKYTGVPCSGNYCPGWQMLDDNSATIGIAAGGDYLYQFHGPNEIIY
jgi:myo-inositol-hexaphosphate 3-phosphohydrolase